MSFTSPIAGPHIYLQQVGRGRFRMGNVHGRIKLQMTTTATPAANLLENSIALQHFILKRAHLCKSALP